MRADRLTSPPEVGRFYLVPCVRYEYLYRLDWWPVMGRRHDDAEHLDFPWPHYHIDLRFLTRRQANVICPPDDAVASWRNPVRPLDNETLAIRCANTPLGEGTDQIIAMRHGPLPRPQLRRRRCTATSHDYPRARAERHPPFRRMFSAFRGQQCQHGKAGWICPHKQFALGSIAPDADGILTCPLHGLRIDAASGKVVG